MGARMAVVLRVGNMQVEREPTLPAAGCGMGAAEQGFLHHRAARQAVTWRRAAGRARSMRGRSWYFHVGMRCVAVCVVVLSLLGCGGRKLPDPGNAPLPSAPPSPVMPPSRPPP